MSTRRDAYLPRAAHWVTPRIGRLPFPWYAPAPSRSMALRTCLDVVAHQGGRHAGRSRRSASLRDVQGLCMSLKRRCGSGHGSCDQRFFSRARLPLRCPPELPPGLHANYGGATLPHQRCLDIVVVDTAPRDVKRRDRSRRAVARRPTASRGRSTKCRLMPRATSSSLSSYSWASRRQRRPEASCMCGWRRMQGSG